MALKLHTVFGNIRGNMAFVAADMAGVKLELKEMQWTDLGSQEFLKIHPLGKIPVLQTENGIIFETTAILRYLARLNPKAMLLGANEYEEAIVNQWLDFANVELVENGNLTLINKQTYGFMEFNKEQMLKARKDLDYPLQILDQYLEAHNVLAGYQITIADICICGYLQTLMKYVFSDYNKKQFHNIYRYYAYVANQPSFKKYYGKPYYSTKEWYLTDQESQQEIAKTKSESKKQKQDKEQKQSEPKEKQEKEKKPEKQNKQDKQEKQEKKEKKEKKEGDKEEKKKDQQNDKKEKQQKEPKKEAKKEAKKPKETDNDNDDIDDKPKPKEKNPLDSLPASPFDLYSFKTFFVNEPDKNLAVTEFLKQFDKNGYSLWHVKYDKLKDEFPKGWLADNARDMTLQRLSGFTKYSFGTFGVFEQDNDFDIKGIWLWRGTEIPKEIKELPNYEYHFWNKLDMDKDEDRKRLQLYWTSFTEGADVEGQKVFSVKYLK